MSLAVFKNAVPGGIFNSSLLKLVLLALPAYYYFNSSCLLSYLAFEREKNPDCLAFSLLTIPCG